MELTGTNTQKKARVLPTGVSAEPQADEQPAEIRKQVGELPVAEQPAQHREDGLEWGSGVQGKLQKLKLIAGTTSFSLFFPRLMRRRDPGDTLKLRHALTGCIASKATCRRAEYPHCAGAIACQSGG